MKKTKKCTKDFFLLFLLMLMIGIMMPMIGSANIQAASTVKISKTNISLVKTQKYKLAVKGTSQKVKWSSSKPTVATVNSQGIVNAKKKGNTVITAFVNNKTYRCKVIVEEPEFINKSIEMPYASGAYLYINSDKKMSRCKSSNPDIITAYISTGGWINVSSKGFGSATITAYIGNYQMKCTVTVKDPKFNRATYCVNVLNFEMLDLSFGRAPKNVEFYVEDPTIATIQTTYANSRWTIGVTGKNIGTTFIEAKCAEKTYKCKIIVDEPIFPINEDIAIAHGDSYQLEMKNTVRKCSFSSSNNVVSINSSGLISGDVCGHSTINVKLSPAANKNEYYSAEVYVCMSCEMYAGYARLLLQQGVYKNCKSFTINGLYDAMDLTQRIVNGVKMDYTVITADGATITDSVLISETRQIAKNGYTLITNDNIIGNINVQKFKPQNLVYISSFLGNKEYVNKVFWHKIRNDFKATKFYGNQL